MKRALLLLAMLAPAAFGAVPTPLPLVVNSHNDNAPLLQLYRGSPRTIRVQFKDGTAASDLTGLTTNDLHLTWNVAPTSTAYVASDVALVDATNGTADFTFTSQDLNYAPGLYYYEASAGSTIVRQGRMQLGGGVFSTGTNSPAWTTNVNLSGYTFSNYPWITDAPSDGTTYGRQNAGWVAVTGGGGSVTAGQWNASVAGASNLAFAVGAGATNLWSGGTGALWAAINSKGTGSVGSLSNVATGTPLYVESDPVWVASSNSIGTRITAAAQAATNADIKAAQAQVLGTNAYALALLGVTNLVPTNAAAGRAYNLGGGTWAIGTNDTAGGGGGSETQGLASVLSLGNSATNMRIVSADVLIGASTYAMSPLAFSNDLYFPVLYPYGGNVMVGGSTNDLEDDAPTPNVIYKAAASAIIGGTGCVISNATGRNASNDTDYLMYNGMMASHDSEIVVTPNSRVPVKYNGVYSANNIHIFDSAFVGCVSGGGTTVSNANGVALLASSHSEIFGTGTNTLQTVLHFGGASIITSSFSAVFAGRGYSDTNYYRDHGDNSFSIGMGTIWQGDTLLFSNGAARFSTGAAQSPYTNNQEGAGYWVSNVEVQVNSRLLVGPGNVIGATVTNVGIYGGAGANVISNGANNDVVGGAGHNLGGGASSGSRGILSGTNNAQAGGTYASVIAGGRANRIGASTFYAFLGGGNLNGMFGGNDYATIGGGENNSNGTLNVTHGFIGGGKGNRANANYATIPGGASNTVLGVGGAAIGNMGTVAAVATNSVVINCDPLYPATNSAPVGMLIAGRGGLQLAALNSVPWEVGGIRFITNADVRIVTPLRQGSFAYDVGSNAFYIAEASTTNDWQKLTP